MFFMCTWEIKIIRSGTEFTFAIILDKITMLRKKYENLKIELAKKYQYNREAYTDAKSSFIKSITERVKREIK